MLIIVSYHCVKKESTNTEAVNFKLRLQFILQWLYLGFNYKSLSEHTKMFYVELYFKTYYVRTQSILRHSQTTQVWVPPRGPIPILCPSLLPYTFLSQSTVIKAKMQQNIITNKTCMYQIFFSQSDFSGLNFPVMQDVLPDHTNFSI